MCNKIRKFCARGRIDVASCARMPLKKIDSRIKTLVENGVVLNHRSLFMVVGDHGRDQVIFT